MNRFLSSSILLILFTFGCGGSGDDKIVIDFWTLGAEGEYILELIPAFEKENPGIEVNVQQIPWTAAQEKLITAVASDNTPDLCQLGNTWIPQFVALNSLEILDEYVSSSDQIKKENYFDGIWSTNIIENKLYGIPWYIDTRVLFYRTDVLAEAGLNHPPQTWEELYDVSKKIKEIPGKKDKYAIYLPANEWASFVIFGLQAGSTILKNNNRYGNFSGSKFKKAFEFLVKFHKQGLAPIGISQVTNVYQAFKDEYFAMYISGPWNINEFKKWMTEDLKDKWMTAPLPGPDENTQGVSLAGGSSLVMFNNSEKKIETWKFIEFLSRPSIQLNFYKLVNSLPAVKDAWNDSTLAGDKYIHAFYKQFHHVAATPKIPEWERIVFSKLQQYAEFAVRGTMTTDEALKALDEDVNNILEKRRWLLENE
ncbi:MAG: sugar ABC transporter substrate-binding protein [Melioribacteraceae bacterium]|nr:sugar ABC transporter substrate-binding protein [Melioribacteraceae bacterium]MCF8355424.1 sugar ABC transporter substrate-binding protein [Melioribacteraceae bacterium]MCF8393266.1 sugar ABC transporter substrate-binding protein [Melioribacteraceae bacterium]MCF8417567.1 sugar ABC transporter substrate-binding protein [Melioribacteraceae bacterium]